MRRWLVLGLLFFVAAGWLLGWSPYLRVQSISVEGARYVSKESILAASGVTPGQPMARITGARVERALTSLSRIKKVSLTRSWPDHLTIVVSERKPIAMVGSQAIDIDGQLFALGSGEKAPTSKIILGTASKEDVRNWLEIFSRLPQRQEVSEVDLRDMENISFKRGSTRIVWGSLDQAETKLKVLAELSNKNFSSIDLSAPFAPTTRK